MNKRVWLRALVAAAMLTLGTGWQAIAMGAEKSVVLVHGAFADGSCWTEVARLLQARGIKVTSVQNPLASLKGDIDAVNRVVDQREGQVVLVAHSWGGMVISGAGLNPKVSGLVYVAAFSPDVGMTVAGMTAPYPTPWLDGVLVDAAGNLVLSEATFLKYFAPDLPETKARVLAAVQGPTFKGTLEESLTDVAWRSKPTWYIRARQDQIIDPALQILMADRMHARTLSIDSGHTVMISHASEVSAVILAALR